MVETADVVVVGAGVHGASLAFHLFHIGAAVFADAGRTWGNDVAGEPPLGWLADAGIGLRIGNARSGLGNVLHVDLAVPLVSQPGIDSVQLLVETRHSF